MTEQMTPDEVLATIARHRDTHESLGVVDAYSAQEYPRLRDAHAAVAALIARNAELEAEVIGRSLGEVHALIAENAALQADRDHLLTSLRIIRDCEFFGGDEWLQAVEVLQKMAGNAITHNEKVQAARAEAGHG